ncbi:MAG: hypothetical protein INQ03_06895 [Candidatus Heimdallarchaeota archaeon]|nr:hypothetical protein [Candidatus Heimdallarchaeota archaeon]
MDTFLLKYIRKQRRTTLTQLVDRFADQHRVMKGLRSLMDQKLIIKVDTFYRPTTANDKVFLQRKQLILQLIKDTDDPVSIYQLAQLSALNYPAARRAVHSLLDEQRIEIINNKYRRNENV